MLATVPASIIQHIVMAVQIPISQRDLNQYDTSETRRRHLGIIQEYLQIAPFNSQAQQVMRRTLAMAVVTKHNLADLL